jgi:hypothetical protein
MFTARIATHTDGFLAAFSQDFGKNGFYWCDENMTPLRAGSLEDWLWATTSWDSPLERGGWSFDWPDGNVLPFTCEILDYSDKYVRSDLSLLEDYTRQDFSDRYRSYEFEADRIDRFLKDYKHTKKTIA